MLIPAQKTPALSLPTLDHGTFDLDQTTAANGTLLIFYRGLHCPICQKQLAEVEGKLAEFAKRDVDVVMISSDDEDRARQTVEKAGVSKVKVAHSLSLKEASEDWGLYISSARQGSAEPALFNEPGIFYIQPDRTLYFGWVQTAPFARPQIDDILGALDFAIDKNYPPRGKYQGPLDAAA